MTEAQNTKRPGALIAMSGGVDSSVAVLLMQRAGYDCIGATMRLEKLLRLFSTNDLPLFTLFHCFTTLKDRNSCARQKDICYYATKTKVLQERRQKTPYGRGNLRKTGKRAPHHCEKPRRVV